MFEPAKLPFVLALGLMLLSACAHLPAGQAEGTPAAGVARESLASLRANGVTIGAAIAVDDRHLLTNAHVVRQAGGTLTLRHADGLSEVTASVAGISPHMDLAALRMPQGFLRGAPLAPELPEAGEAVWAMGPEGLGRALVAGRVERLMCRCAALAPASPPGWAR
jgi:S1-C subfamily serine protease